ncbi:MAG: cysteine desulfurase [Lachnospiraceae bacterium]|nr:cysteine desulfurase [Lachnospiraceae bacterium]
MKDKAKSPVYMDNASTMPLLDEALEAMMPYLKGMYYNPGAVYDSAQRVKRDVEEARESVASSIGATVREIFFTSGATESDNTAIKGIPGLKEGSHIIVSSFEHHAVLNACRDLEKKGVRVSYVNPTKDGYIRTEEIERLINKDTVLVSVMTVNNELGTVQDIREIGAMAHEHGILFHTDAAAAAGHIPIDVKELNVDLMSAGAHKFGGPKGAGFLYVKEGLKLNPLISGGGQERGMRSGTENVAGIIGMAAALKHMTLHMEENLAIRRELDEYFKSETGDGSPFHRLPGHFSVTLPGINAEELVVRLGMKGICISTGAACASSAAGPSHVLKAIGLKGDALKSTIRISMSENNTKEEIDILLNEIRNMTGGIK